MYLYNNIKIKGAWQHDDGRSIPRGWVEGATPAQLLDYNVIDTPDISPPAYDPLIQYITEQPDGSYIITNYTQEQLDAQALQNDLSSLQTASGKSAIIVLVELIDYLLANTAMTAADFTPNVRQSYQDIKIIADRVK